MGGMKEAIMKFFLEPRCLNKNVLPVKVKEDHPQLTSEAYDKKEWAISVANTGTNKPEKYYRLYCQHCEKRLLPKLLEEYSDRLGENKNLTGLINNWDILNVPAKYIDYVGCFLPWQSDVRAGPNAQKFIWDQSEHPKTSHIYTVDAKASNKKLKRQTSLLDKTTSKPPSKVIVLDKEPGPTAQVCKEAS